MCGSSGNPEHVKILLEGRQPALMVTDPPYGVDYGSVEEMRHDCAENCKTREGIQNDKTLGTAKVVWDYTFGNIYPYIRDGGSFYVFSPQGPNFYELAKSLEDAGFTIHQHIIWNKDRFIFSRSDYKYKHEMIIYGWKKGTHTFYGGGNEISVWDCDAPVKSELHPTQKPVALYEKAILNSSQVGEWVLDPFGGSGTIIEACEKMKRKALMMELDPGYCESALERSRKLGLVVEKV
jgi:DNA modification methylase